MTTSAPKTLSSEPAIPLSGPSLGCLSGDGRMRVLSLGAGVQSSTLALMIEHGEIPPVECAVFADTEAEPESVYRWLDWLEKQLSYPVHRISRGSLEDGALRLRTSKGGVNYTKHAIPAFIVDDQGRTGLAMRQCTADFKIEVIQRHLRAIRKGRAVEQLIGISLDEIHRCKPSRLAYVENTWPLIDARLRRHDCLRWLAAHNYPTPPRSACVFCPYRANREWKKMKAEEPAAFERACRFEEKYQAALGQVSGFRGVPFLHRSLVPLATVDFNTDDHPDLFGNECEGMCGV